MIVNERWRTADPAIGIGTVNGMVEVIEHPQDTPFFRITDDSQLVDQAKESIAKEGCRKEP
jgi:hypothetical protein